MLSPRIMLLLAQVILSIGAVSLVAAAIRLFRWALAAGLPAWYLWWILPIFLVVGVAKAVFVMRKQLRLNIQRIATAKEKLWPWQIYPARLLVFIFSMVILMNVMKRLLADNALGLGLLGGIDVAVAAAMVVASTEYRRSKD